LTLATPENIEAVGDAGIPYADEFDLTEKLQRVLRDGSLVQSYRHRAQIRVQRYYDWERVVDQYEQLFAEMTGKLADTRSSGSGIVSEVPKETALSRK
jgi:glycosyltransferase involved in cell wall biosynthesis